MGSDFARILHSLPSPHPHPPSNHHSTPPSLSALDAPSDRSRSTAASLDLLSNSLSREEAAGSEQARLHPHLTNPPTSTSYSTSSVPAPVQTTSWTAVNHPPRAISSQGPGASGNPSRGLAPLQPRPAAPQSEAVASPSSGPQGAQFQPTRRMNSVNSTNAVHGEAFTPVKLASSGRLLNVRNVCSGNPSALIPAGLTSLPPSSSPRRPIFHPNTPLSPAPSPEFQPGTDTSSAYPPSQSQQHYPASPGAQSSGHLSPESTKAEPVTLEDSIQSTPFPAEARSTRHPRSRKRSPKRRLHNVRFVDPAGDMSMMPPPVPANSSFRHPMTNGHFFSEADMHGRDRTGVEEAPVHGLIPPYSSTATSQTPTNIPSANAMQSRMTEGVSLGTAPSQQRSDSMSTTEPCQRCSHIDLEVLQLALAEQHYHGRPISMATMSLEDYDKTFDSFRNSVRGSFERSNLIRGECPQCGSSPDREDLIRIAFHNRYPAAASPESMSLTNKRKSPSAITCNNVDESSKSRRVTPDSAPPPLCQFTPPPEPTSGTTTSQDVSERRPMLSLMEAEAALWPLTKPGDQEEDVNLSGPLRNTARALRMDHEWNSTYNPPPLDMSMWGEPGIRARKHGRETLESTSDESSHATTTLAEENR